MKQAYGISGGALAAALLGMLFCIWTALGNEVAFCVTAGCSLYQDLVIGGLSMWWIGTAAFGVLACLALLGAVPAGHFLAGLTLLGDIFLLLLMALTSPCVICLVVACFFALTYWLFRRALHRDDRRPQERSLLLCAWLVLFVVNAGQVVRMQGEVWSISENSDQATVRMFFSPSCSACREGIGILSGSVDVAFCPVAENDADVARVERMLLLLEEGKTLKEAVAACQNVEEPGPWAFLHPGQWGLRLRLLGVSEIRDDGGNPARDQHQTFARVAGKVEHIAGVVDHHALMFAKTHGIKKPFYTFSQCRSLTYGLFGT